jgi:hypothetical protein
MARANMGGMFRAALFIQSYIRGRAVQVDPVKPTLKPPGAKHLKLKHDKLPSKFAFKFNLHHYIAGTPPAAAPRRPRRTRPRVTAAAWPVAGPRTRNEPPFLLNVGTFEGSWDTVSGVRDKTAPLEVNKRVIPKP